MGQHLDGKTIASPAADGGQEVEYVGPKQAVEEAGARTELISLDDGEIQAMEGDITPTRQLAGDKSAAADPADDYAALVLPGGPVNPDSLRQDEVPIGFWQEFFAAGKPVGAICHGP